MLKRVLPFSKRNKNCTLTSSTYMTAHCLKLNITTKDCGEDTNFSHQGRMLLFKCNLVWYHFCYLGNTLRHFLSNPTHLNFCCDMASKWTTRPAHSPLSDASPPGIRSKEKKIAYNKYWLSSSRWLNSYCSKFQYFNVTLIP